MLQNVRVDAFTTEYDRIVNVLKTDVLISKFFHPELGAKPPDPHKFQAIWDTGATNTVITKKVIDICNLKPTGMAQTNTVGGTILTETFLIAIGLPSKILIPTIKVTVGEIKDSDVLIGMDIINLGDFSLTKRDNKTVLSFRTPSVSCIDFVMEIQNNKESEPTPHVGRNDPCPCGSGKKYKKCCGR